MMLMRGCVLSANALRPSANASCALSHSRTPASSTRPGRGFHPLQTSWLAARAYDSEVSDRDLVQQLAEPMERLDAMRSLVGGVTATELRHVQLTPSAFQALTDGTADSNPQVRWWAIQLLDHVPDDRTIGCFLRALDDPVPRVRRNAAHALGCRTCKPGMTSQLPAAATERLARLVLSDTTAKVRAEARRALTCTSRPR